MCGKQFLKKYRRGNLYRRWPDAINIFSFCFVSQFFTRRHRSERWAPSDWLRPHFNTMVEPPLFLPLLPTLRDSLWVSVTAPCDQRIERKFLVSCWSRWSYFFVLQLNLTASSVQVQDNRKATWQSTGCHSDWITQKKKINYFSKWSIKLWLKFGCVTKAQDSCRLCVALQSLSKGQSHSRFPPHCPQANHKHKKKCYLKKDPVIKQSLYHIHINILTCHLYTCTGGWHRSNWVKILHFRYQCQMAHCPPGPQQEVLSVYDFDTPLC